MFEKPNRSSFTCTFTPLHPSPHPPRPLLSRQPVAPQAPLPRGLVPRSQAGRPSPLRCGTPSRSPRHPGHPRGRRTSAQCLTPSVNPSIARIYPSLAQRDPMLRVIDVACGRMQAGDCTGSAAGCQGPGWRCPGPQGGCGRPAGSPCHGSLHAADGVHVPCVRHGPGAGCCGRYGTR